MTIDLFPCVPSVVMTEKMHWVPHFDRPRPGFHVLFLIQHNGKILYQPHASKTTNSAASIMQNFSLQQCAIIQGYLPAPSETPANASIRGTMGYDTNLGVRRDNALAPAGQVTWIESLLRSPTRVHYVVLQGISVAEDVLLNFLQTSPFLTAVVIWEPVGPKGKYLSMITDKFINRLAQREKSLSVPQVTARGKIHIGSTNWKTLPNLTYLELNGTLAFDSAGLVDMLKLRCNPSWIRTGVGLVPSIQLRSLCLHYREEPMDRSSLEEVYQLFAPDDREFFIYEDNNPNVTKLLGEEQLNREVSAMFDTYIDTDAYIAS